jgi:glycosyltransferase involved in cell wall biosynthesis
MKIAIYAIALNESKHVDRFMDAIVAECGADWVYVADTGSTDDTVDRLEARGANVVKISIKPWRFDDARNAALAMLPDDIDVCVSLDLDEVLQPGWRQEIERVWTAGTTRLRYGFDWGAGIVFQYEKIHSRHGYRWFGPCHEYPVADRITERWADTDMLLVVHKPDSTKSRGQYLDLLRISTEENPSEPRNAFYYARELSWANQWVDAIREAKRYLELPRATWPKERAYAMRVMAKCYMEMRDWPAALQWARNACSEASDTREPWCLLAEICYHTYRWAEMFGAAMSALYISKREKLYTVDPAVWGFQPHDWAAISAWNLGMKDVALEHAKKCVEMSPDDMRLRQNLKMIEDDLKQGAAA